MKVLETDRLVLRWFTSNDAAFILKLLNEPGWKQFIGDRGVNNLDDARSYIDEKLIASYQQHGFGLYAVLLKDDATLIGMCGLVKRDGLDDIDIGFALLACYEGQGYAAEAARATLNYAYEKQALGRVVAITAADNGRSIRLLKRLGMAYEGTVKLTVDGGPVELFAIEMAAQNGCSK